MSTMQAPKQEARKKKVTEAEARAVTEEARQKEWSKPSFMRQLFLGDLRMDLIHPHPRLSAEDEARTREFLSRVESFLDEQVDALQIERDKKIPQDVIDGLAELGTFGLKIPEEYGGLGLSQQAYNRTIALIASKHSALGVLLSAHQSIGVPQPLKMFGTEAQKRKYLPRCAAGSISAFALTEPDVGSDPARMGATADPTEDGSAYVLNGEKLWCTNGPLADVMVVMAGTPAADGGRRRISAFIVETDWDGVEVDRRLDFMGLHGIENGVIRFDDVRVPKENILWGEGKGLKLALITLNTGRLTIPATAAAGSKWCLNVVREWSNARKQWGGPIGKHDAIAQKVGDIAATTFAMESVSELSAALADTGGYDIRMEAAVAKMWNSEAAWRIADETMQIRGGRGYETADSLASRGEAPIAVEQVLRDTRINLIFEGSSEIMRLFLAREAVDPHLQRAGALFEPDASMGAKARSVLDLGVHMTGFMAGNMVGWSRAPRYAEFGRLATHIRFADRRASKLARTLGWAMARFGPKLEKKQSVLFRLVDIGAELFVIAATCARAQMLLEDDPQDESPLVLADLFCRGARRRVDETFGAVFDNDDTTTYRIAQDVLAGRFRWLEDGVVLPPTPASH